MNHASPNIPDQLKVQLFDKDSFVTALSNQPPIPLYKNTIQSGRDTLNQWFRKEVNIDQLVYSHTWLIDQILITVWEQSAWDDSEHISLLAVGGYGRGELHPGSDIDILILLEHDEYQTHQTEIETFLTTLWDIGLTVGSSVRSIKECAEQARDDLTIITNLMEARPLSDPENLNKQLQEKISVHRMWPSNQYLQAKFDEQKARHKKYADTAYSLEPNIKGSPGGIRDLHMLGWTARRHFGTQDPIKLMALNFLTEAEYEQLIRCRAFLWKIRWALHTLTGRGEDRLLFDHQRSLAEQFGYQDQPGSLAVEQFMQSYFRTVLIVGQFKDLILQNFDDKILNADKPQTVTAINDRFQIRNQYIEVTHDRVFAEHPPAILEMFVLMTRDPDILGPRAETIRLLRDIRHTVDSQFRKDPRCAKLFLQLLQAPYGLTISLRRMARYGILGRYLPEFGRIIGQMQFDLFHSYTVDAHTLLLIKHLRSFRYEENKHRYPIASQIIHDIKKPELLYVAGLYHDIGKGRGGDHSQLGAVDAEVFCRRHGLRRVDTKLIVWLVREHLTLSTTAQKKDLSDPEVIQDFARKVGNLNSLNHLYLLTVADINATNPELWNGWRSSLLQQLYSQTRLVLEYGIENMPDSDERLQDIQQETLELLADDNLDIQSIHSLWNTLDDDYFSRHDPHEIAWHTQGILAHQEQQPLVLTRETDTDREHGGSQIFVYAPDRPNLFAATVAGLDSLHISIQDARIITSSDQFSLDTYTVLEEDGSAIGNNESRILQIQSYLQDILSDPGHMPVAAQRRTPRQLRHFAKEPLITISNLPGIKKTLLEIKATDRPGLLARVVRTFVELELQVHNAKVATFGEKLEDSFFITDKNHQPISDPDVAEHICLTLKQILQQASEQDVIRFQKP
ncbi:[protein-PII] uridylyltransferase [Endozoicomonas sp. 8E]|uniref:[protein-PII] uridylyltransferase n=1 Tax=Endozoicomonas sp. 8E TaxID=3035692 RepID=UPI002939119C|nr:[protein-PII] uridylyltransferase [Endozoicomonas sp. 8E]WOG25475.1 [protein-PII] uridylyltransferase [Endozoicomonas sp. 8E]